MIDTNMIGFACLAVVAGVFTRFALTTATALYWRHRALRAERRLPKRGAGGRFSKA